MITCSCESGLTITLQYINKCLCWGRSVWAQWLNSNSLFWSPLERLEDLRHLRGNYEKHTQAIYFAFGPMGLFERAKALKSEEQRGRGVGFESSIMMTMFHKALVSSSHRTAKTVYKQEGISTCIYQEAEHIPACQQSLIYVNVLMLFHRDRIQYEVAWIDGVCKWTEIMCNLSFSTLELFNMCMWLKGMHILCGNPCLCLCECI